MINPGYYAVFRDTLLTLGPKRTRLRRHDWLVTDGQHIGVFDKYRVIDWVPLEWTSGRPILLTDELAAQIEEVATPTTFAQLERRLQQQLDTEDGAPIPDMPRPSLLALGPYLRANKSYTYDRQSIEQ